MNKLEIPVPKNAVRLVCAALLIFANAASAATISILGPSAPAPGPDDQYQTNAVNTPQSPPPGGGGFNYWISSGTSPGQTFTTGSNPDGYVLNTLALFDCDATGGGFGYQSFKLGLYAVNGSTATLITTYTSQSIALTDFNWFQWTNLNAVLQPNTQYAFAMWTDGPGWMNLGNNSVDYAGGQVAIVPQGGGTMTFSSSSPWNADFNVGLTPITAVAVDQPTFSPSSAALSGTTITASAVVAGPGPYYFQWQTDGGSGGTLTNIPGGTSSNLVINTTGFTIGNHQYGLMVSNDSSSATSQIAVLTIQQPASSANITLLGSDAPIPGTSDQYQTNFVAVTQSPPPGGGGFNYYVSSGTSPGQTFTTGSNPSGYFLNSLALYDAAGTGGGFGYQSFKLGLYAVNGSTATLITTYTSQSIALTDFNWFQWTNLNAVLQPNTQYAFAMWTDGPGWMNLGNNSVDYAGGQVAIVPQGGGTMTFSSSSPWNADFNVGLTVLTTPVIGQPKFSPYSVTLPGTTITASASAYPVPDHFQWQTDGGSGGTLTNIPGATNSSLVINTTGFALGNYQYDLVAANSFGSSTSHVAVLTVQQPVGVPGVIAVKFGFTGGYATSDTPLPADNAGVATGQIVPPSYQPLTAVGNWNNLQANLPASGSTGGAGGTRAAAINQTWNIAQDTAGNSLSGVTLTPGGFDDGWYSGGTECANGRLLYDCWKFDTSNGQLDAYNHNYATLTFDGLPGATYDVIVYINNNTANYWGNMQANSVVAQGGDYVDNLSFGYQGDHTDPCDANPPLHTAAGFGTDVNYVKMGAVATSGGQITITMVNFGGGSMGFSGVELVPSPDITMTQDILPSYAETTVGSQVVYSAAFNDSPAINIQWLKISGVVTNTINAGVSATTNSGVITSILTLSNVQLNDSAIYMAQAVNATNSSDYASSSQSQLVVSNPPAPVNNVVVYNDARTGSNFYPPWSINTNADLVYNSVNDPTGSGTPGTFTALGSFVAEELSATDPSVLVDGFLTDTTVAAMLCCGPGKGTSVTYFLNTNSSPLGFDLTKIAVYGGWGNAGRRDQQYQILYSTVDSPGVYIPLISTHYLPADPSSGAIATRTTLVPGAGAMAHNVAAVQINWDLQPQYLNGYAFYSEIEVEGTNSAPSFPVLQPVSISGGNLVLIATGGTPNAGYTWLQTTNLTPPVVWTTNMMGTLDGTGSLSNAIPVNQSQPDNFFRLRMP